MGGSAELIKGVGLVVGTENLLPYQCVGTSGHPQCMPCLLGLHQTLSGSHTEGKYHRNVLCEQASSRLLCLEAINLWQFCIEEDITPVAIHLLGVQNRLADHLSRVVFTTWGISMINLFVTRENSKCHMFCSWEVCRPGSISDAFHCSWQLALLYAFPPIP